jgi:hypothetical protein
MATAATQPRPARALTWLLTAGLCVIWALWAPPVRDLAAQDYRGRLAELHPFAIWEHGWFAGHYLPGYSVLVPPLSALLGPRLVGVVGALLATWCFERLARRHWDPQPALAASIAFAVGVLATLIAGQMAFALGLGVGLAALLAGSERRLVLTTVLGAATTLSSPVAAAFLVLACAAWWLADHAKAPLLCAAGAVVPGLAILIAFPEPGVQPFSTRSALISFVLCCAVAIAPPRGERTIRIGGVLAALAVAAAWAIDTALGSNVLRLPAVFALPLLVGTLWETRGLVLVILATIAFAWQWSADAALSVYDASPTLEAKSYYAPLVGELERRVATEGPFRTEVVPLREHWETRWIPPGLPIARGWERQLDVALNPRLYGTGRLSADDYRSWLREQSVRYVALARAPLDKGGRKEAILLRRSPIHGVREVWRSQHWRLFEVEDARPLATPPARVTALSPQTVTLTTPRPATTVLRMRFTPYWALVNGHGCVGPAPGGWTRVRLDQPGRARLAIRFSLRRIRATSDRCTG